MTRHVFLRCHQPSFYPSTPRSPLEFLWPAASPSLPGPLRRLEPATGSGHRQKARALKGLLLHCNDISSLCLAREPGVGAPAPPGSQALPKGSFELLGNGRPPIVLFLWLTEGHPLQLRPAKEDILEPSSPSHQSGESYLWEMCSGKVGIGMKAGRRLLGWGAGKQKEGRNREDFVLLILCRCRC